MPQYDYFKTYLSSAPEKRQWGTSSYSAKHQAVSQQLYWNWASSQMFFIGFTNFFGHHFPGAPDNNYHCMVVSLEKQVLAFSYIRLFLITASVTWHPIHVQISFHVLNMCCTLCIPEEIPNVQNKPDSC